MSLAEIKSILFTYRFEILAVLLTTIIFGGGAVPSTIFEDVFLPVIIFLAAVLAVVSVQKRSMSLRVAFGAFALMALLLMVLRLFTDFHLQVRVTSLLIFILFFAALSYELFRQMVSEKEVTRSIIFAAFDCYLLLGVLGGMLFSLLILLDPDAFTNVGTESLLFNKMNYFSFITLTSIGYGDITPNSLLAEKVTAFFGLIAHFYSVVIVGIIVGKYVSARS